MVDQDKITNGANRRGDSQSNFNVLVDLQNPANQQSNSSTVKSRQTVQTELQTAGSVSLRHKLLQVFLPTALVPLAIANIVGCISAGQQYATIAQSKPATAANTATVDSEIAAAKSRLAVPFALNFLLLGAGTTAGILYVSRRLSAPLYQLSCAAENLAAGQLSEVEVESAGTLETQILARSLNDSVTRLKAVQQAQLAAAEKADLLAELSGIEAANLDELQQVFDRTLAQSRSLLAVDRMVIYRFKPNWGGYIAHESVANGFASALYNETEDACIPESLLQAYRQNRVVPTRDISNAGFTPAHLELMRHLQVKANLVAPILHQGQLFGLLIAHHCQKTHDWQSSEISFIRQLAVQFGAMLDRVMLLQAQDAEAEHSQLVQEITLQIAQAQTPEAVLSQLPVQQIRQILKADRVIIYRFDHNWRGTITVESVDPEFPAALGAEIYDPCFEKDYVTRYQQGRVRAIADIYRAGLTECHLKQLEPFGVRANLVAPILQNRNLLGLLIAHQCSDTRNWQKSEIDFFAQVAAQIGLALDRYDLLEQKELAARQAQDLAEEQRQQKEALQSQLIRLLDEVEEVAKGNLTIRAEVFAGEIGIVADFFNAIAESLCRIVTNVKRSATQVNSALNENEAAVHYLSEQALQQTEETAHSLELVQQLNHSIQAVAERAHQAEAVAQTAATAAVTGETAMNLSVQNILNLRATTEETAKKVKRLGEASQQISRVVGLIDQFALQTNLLAVNAGLEASRAGEQAQGFAVIAEEIAGLAAQCTAATQEITGIARKIEVGTREVVKAIEQSTAQVVEGTRLVEDTKQSLGQMLQVSSQINQLVHSISTTTVSQVQISQEVAGLMQQIAQISEGTLQSSQQVSNSLRQMIEVEQELQASMSVFKVDS